MTTTKRKDMPFVVVQTGGIIVWSTLAPWPRNPYQDAWVLHQARAWALGPDGKKGIYTPFRGWRHIGDDEWDAGR